MKYAFLKNLKKLLDQMLKYELKYSQVVVAG